MKLDYLFLIFFWLFLSNNVKAQKWNVFEVDDGIKPSLKIDTNDTPHIAYMLEDFSGFIKHAEFNGSGFDIINIHSGYFYGPLDIAIDNNNEPHIIYHNHDDEDLNHAFRSSNQWTIERVSDSGHDGWDVIMFIDNDNTIHVSSVDPSGFGGTGVEYAVRTNSWTIESIGSVSLMYANGTSIVINDNGVPSVAYFDDTQLDLRYATKASGSWVHSTIDQDGDVGRFPDMVIDKFGKYHIAYYQDFGDGTGSVKYALMENGQWQINTIDNLNNVALGFSGARHIVSLKYVEPDDKFFISYGDKKVVKYAFKEGNNWFSEIVVDETGSNIILGQQTSMDVDSDGNPHITYFEVNTLGGTIKYVVKDPTITAFTDLNDHYDFKIFPNPTENWFTIDLDFLTNRKIAIEIIDINGAIIKQLNITVQSNQVHINLNDIEAGLYLVKLRNQGKILESRLLIK